MTKTWKEVYTAATEAGFYQAVMAAEENANETIYGEKAAEASEFDRLAFASLGDRLAYSDDRSETSFFEALGIRW